MDRDYLYFHFANLVLVVIGLLSIQQIASPLVMMLLIPGTIVGFVLSWYMRDSRPPHIDTFIGMLSLASVVVVLSRLYDISISFENILRIFSTALAWLSLFQSFGLKTGKSYAIVQFISICLLISSVSLALEQETVYVIYIAMFLFILVFTMRLNLMCDKKRKGSIIIGNRDEVMGLWQQIKIGAIMFSIILILAAFVYPLVPRFNNLSLTWLPSTLMGLPEQIPILKLLLYADREIKENKKVKKEQLVKDESKKRETGIDLKITPKESEENIPAPIIERFQAKEFNKDIDMLKIKLVVIKTDMREVPLDQRCKLTAELNMNDGSIIPATRLVDWKVSGTGKVVIDSDGSLIPKEVGYIQVSASYLGSFSNDLNIKIKEALKPKKKRSFLFYFLVFLIWLIVAALIGFFIWVFRKTKRLKELYASNPKEFVKQIYDALCKAFKIYGIPRFNYMAYREFYNLTKEIISARPEPMHAITENFLEVRFSTHEISMQHSQEAVRLFHEVKDVILEREIGGRFWKNILLRLYILDVLLVPRQ